MANITTATQAPFHPGEVEIQARYGNEKELHELGKRMLRDHLIEQHQEFFKQLPFLLVGSVDEKGRPWASILYGQPGFIEVPHDKAVKVKAKPISGDPLNINLREGIDIGLLGIMLNNRRRNRLNGKVSSMGADEFDIEVVQSFGNCPKYIQQREFEIPDGSWINETTGTVIGGQHLDKPVAGLISKADTFFIASQYSTDSRERSHGVDVSHRGGKPGFVKIEDNTLVIPDFFGNRIFNTFGNLLLNPKAGLLFINFESGDLLYLTGTTEIIFSGKELEAFEGAERLLRFTLDEYILVEKALPFNFELKGYSPFVMKTGEWN